MKKNKTLIKGIILLMLVAVIGTTYAYFAANITGNESSSTIVVTGGRMEIAYDNLSGTIEAYDIYPKNDAWVIKNFTVTGNNTTEKEMRYKVGLSVDNNTFSKSALTYKVTATNTSNMGDVMSITDVMGELAVDNAEMIMAYGEPLLAIGSFPKGEDMVHTYTFELFFKDTGENQNKDQGASFAGHITIEEYPFNEIGLNQENFADILGAVYTQSDIQNMMTTGNFIMPGKFNMYDEWYEIVQVDTNTFDGFAESGINTITLNDGLRIIENTGEPNLTGITNVNIPSTVTYIGENSFKGASLTGTLTIPSTVKYIGTAAFAMTNISNLTLNEGIEYLSGFTGTGISGNIVLPSTVKTIGELAFAGTQISSINFNEGLESIGNYAFQQTTNLTGTLTIPGTVKTIGEGAFTGTKITSINFNEGLESIGDGTFQDVSTLSGNLIIPGSVKTIGNNAFEGTKITGLTLNEGLKTIGQGAFNLTGSLSGSITIPSTVKHIGSYAFSNGYITEINYPGTEVEWNQIDKAADAFAPSIHINYNYTGD